MVEEHFYDCEHKKSSNYYNDGNNSNYNPQSLNNGIESHLFFDAQISTLKKELYALFSMTVFQTMKFY